MSTPATRPVEECTGALPNELLDAILRHLGQPDLLNVSGACQRWRAVARQLPAYYAHLALNAVNLSTGDKYRRAVSKFAETVDCVAATDFSLSLVIRITAEVDVLAAWVLDGLVQTAVNIVLPRYLPRIVNLSVQLEASSIHCFYEAVMQPAPVLRCLALEGRQNSERLLALQPGLPANLLASSAPKLTAVRLCGIPIRSSAIQPAFANVRSLDLRVNDDTDLTVIPAHFPSVAHLALDDLKRGSLTTDPARSILDKLVSLRVTMQSFDCPEPLANLIQQQPVPRVDVEVRAEASTSWSIIPFFSHLSAPVHFTCTILARNHDIGQPRSTRPPPSLILQLHSADVLRTIRIAYAKPDSIALQLPLHISGAISDMCLSRLQLRWFADVFAALPHLLTLSVDLDGIQDHGVLDSARPIQCPELQVVVAHSSRRDGEENFQQILGVLRLFSVYAGGGTRPILVLQGEMAPLIKAAPLVALARFVRVKRSLGFVNWTSCCGHRFDHVL